MKKQSTKNEPLTDAQMDVLGKTLAQAIKTVITQKQFKSFDVKEAIECISDIISMKDNYYAYHEDLLKKHQKNFEYSKRYFKEMTKNGNKAVKGIIKILESYDADPLISLYKFLKQLPKRSCCNHIFKRISSMERSRNLSLGAQRYTSTSPLPWGKLKQSSVKRIGICHLMEL